MCKLWSPGTRTGDGSVRFEGLCSQNTAIAYKCILGIKVNFLITIMYYVKKHKINKIKALHILLLHIILFFFFTSTTYDYSLNIWSLHQFFAGAYVVGGFTKIGAGSNSRGGGSGSCLFRHKLSPAGNYLVLSCYVLWECSIQTVQAHEMLWKTMILSKLDATNAVSNKTICWTSSFYSFLSPIPSEISLHKHN